MTGSECVRRSIEIFEAELALPEGRRFRSVAELARLSGYSVYHFTRLFAALAGTSPKEYIEARSLTVAASLVLDKAVPLSSISERAGYQDYETFSRAFKRRFGVSPKQARAQGAIPAGSLAAAPLEPSAIASLSCARGGPEAISLPAHTICGLPSFAPDGLLSFHAAWDSFSKVQGRIRGRLSTNDFCQFSSWTEDNEAQGISLLCALVVDPSREQEPLFYSRALPAAEYARFSHRGPLSALRETYGIIYGSWMAEAGQKPAANWEFQRYPGPEAVDIYIPVKLL
jgi:AraC family transcriptional regulator